MSLFMVRVIISSSFVLYSDEYMSSDLNIILYIILFWYLFFL